MTKCKACEDGFYLYDELVVVNDTYYHKDCVSLYPKSYVAFLGDAFLGETENEDGQAAYEVLHEDDLLED
ncbi:hypothetical protein [Shouchella clausii]|jgi:hypothetical protein|uniref:LIM zinc-binding domain-containing protein n=1 Tax=Shouchella clausii TaxID=79880 RepID=A0A268NWW9_SHOCL|nr:hypothetical protein [Shouchella clausii]PAE87739.1 hypothetical protein CHH72_16550 [Shouchella clausii]